MDDLVKVLKDKKLTIGSCESLTAGLFTSQLAQIPGASAVLKGGLVTYMTACKIEVAGVDSQIVDAYGVISKECAIEMAVKAKQRLDVDVCVSFTGNAGPGAMEGKPAGLIFSAIALDERVIVYEYKFCGGRNEVRQNAVAFMYEKLMEELQK